MAAPLRASILVADDHAAAREKASRLLCDAGYKVDLASSGSDAIGAPLERFVVVWKRLRNKHGPAKSSGTALPLAACSIIQPTKAKQPLAKR